jgi:hypothetical protein
MRQPKPKRVMSKEEFAARTGVNLEDYITGKRPNGMLEMDFDRLNRDLNRDNDQGFSIVKAIEEMARKSDENVHQAGQVMSVPGGHTHQVMVGNDKVEPLGGSKYRHTFTPCKTIDVDSREIQQQGEIQKGQPITRNATGEALEYIRNRYQVPAYLGVKVIVFDGRKGEIVGAEGGYLLIKVDDNPNTGRYHPTWKIKYQAAIKCDGCGKEFTGNPVQEAYCPECRRGIEECEREHQAELDKEIQHEPMTDEELDSAFREHEECIAKDLLDDRDGIGD